MRVAELERIKAQAATTIMFVTPCLHGIHVRFADVQDANRVRLDLLRGPEAVWSRTRLPLDAPAGVDHALDVRGAHVCLPNCAMFTDLLG